MKPLVRRFCLAPSLPALLLLSSLAQAAMEPAEVSRAARCLDSNDLPCVRELLEGAASRDSNDNQYQQIKARLLFHEGRYIEARDLLASTRPLSCAHCEEHHASELHLFSATAEATSDFVELRKGELILRYAPGPDLILVEEAMDVLERARLTIDPVLGGHLPQPILLEIYPTAHRFTEASGLGQDAVQTTGVVALSKWARLLVTSPRALARGYAWKDTVVHEYIHEVVAYRSDDRAPVWLQEGIARHLDTTWRGESQPLGPYPQSLLAQAISRNNLVTFEEMHPSMAFLPSAERASLAFAQVKLFVDFAIQKGGPDTLVRTLDAVRTGADARHALASSAGYSDFDSFLQDAMSYVRSLEFVSRKLSQLPTVIEGSGDDFDSDPLLAERRDLAEFARLGDLLREAGRPKAALVEYRKATEKGDETASPLLVNRIAACHVLLGDKGQALNDLISSARDYPEYALTWKSIGEIVLSLGRQEEALGAYLNSADLNPFDPEVQSRISTLYGAMGETKESARHARHHRVLLTGGLAK